MDTCIFCRIINGEIPSSKVYEDESVVAFMDIQPVNTGHILVIPKKHVQLIADLDDATAAHLMTVAGRIDRALRGSSLRCEGVNYFLADGEAAMQEVPHVHLHVFPRFTEDGFGIKIPNHYHTMPSREELNLTAAEIRNLLPA